MANIVGRKRPAQPIEGEPSPAKRWKKEERVTHAVRNRGYRRQRRMRNGRRHPFVAQEGMIIQTHGDMALGSGPLLTDIDVTRTKRWPRDIDIARERGIIQIGRIARRVADFLVLHIGEMRPSQDIVWKFLVESTDSGMVSENSY